MKLIFVCSPLVGNVPADTKPEEIAEVMRNNERMAEAYCWYVSHLGHAPYAPHLLCTRFLDDTIPTERQAGIDIGLEVLIRADELWIFLNGIHEFLSRGMSHEVELAIKLGKPVRIIERKTVLDAWLAAKGEPFITF